MLHAVLDRAVKERLIPETPARTAPSQRPGSLLSPERGLLPMFYLELVCGLRKGELVALWWDDLDIQ